MTLNGEVALTAVGKNSPSPGNSSTDPLSSPSNLGLFGCFFIADPTTVTSVTTVRIALNQSTLRTDFGPCLIPSRARPSRVGKYILTSALAHDVAYLL